MQKILVIGSFLLILVGCCIAEPWWGALVPVGIGCSVLGIMILKEHKYE